MIGFRVGLSATLLVSLAICAGTLTSFSNSNNFVGDDKLHHVIAFTCFVLPMILVSPKYWRAMITYSLIFGGVIELAQPYVNKTGDPMDLLANTAGAIIGTVMGATLFRFHQLRREKYKPIYIDRTIRTYCNHKYRR